MKVLICDPVSDDCLKELNSKDYLEVDVKVGLSPEELKKNIVDYDCIVVRSATKVKKPIIDAGKNLKLIVRGGVGLDNIDVEYAESKGITVKNTPAASSVSVAELALAHMFALSRHIFRGTQSVKEGKWEKKALQGVELFGKTLGIIGIGRIGTELARRAKALGMKVIAYDSVVKSSDFAEMVDLNTLYTRSDYISLHVPLTEKTKDLIGRESISKMKKGVFIINCARAGIINNKALEEALKNGKVAGAGIDVFEKDPPYPEEILDLPNVTYTPHIGASTKEAQNRVGEEVVKIICEFFEHKTQKAAQ